MLADVNIYSLISVLILNIWNKGKDFEYAIQIKCLFVSLLVGVLQTSPFPSLLPCCHAPQSRKHLA